MVIAEVGQAHDGSMGLAHTYMASLQLPGVAYMGKRGHEIAEREFSADRMARQTLAVYQELVENC